MEHAVGKITINRFECPYCGKNYLFFAHNMPRSLCCASCKTRVSVDEKYLEEEVTLILDLLIGENVIVNSVIEDYD